MYGPVRLALDHRPTSPPPSPLSQEPQIGVRTREIWVQNVGRSPVDELDIVLNYKPYHIEIWPKRQVDDTGQADGGYLIRASYLAPREFFKLSMFDSVNDLPDVASVRTKSGNVKKVEMGPRQLFSLNTQRAFQFVQLVGMTALLYVALTFLRYLIGF